MTGHVTTGDTEMAAPSNVRLIRALEDRLAREPWISNFSVRIQAHAGILTLRGLVNTAAEAFALETMARAIKGCEDVASHLLIRPSGGRSRTRVRGEPAAWLSGVTSALRQANGRRRRP